MTQASEKWDRRFLELARLVSTWSKDPSTQVGAVIAADKRLVSVGFNGFPRDMDDTIERYANRTDKYSRVVHAEVNALIFAGTVPPWAVLYTYPFLPCDRCVVQMLQAGIRNFVSLKPTVEALERWGTAFALTKGYITECGGNWYEFDRL